MHNLKIKKLVQSIKTIMCAIPNLANIRFQYRLNIMSSYKTVRYIKKTNCSIARFGDGEFDLILNDRNLGFQKSSREISAALISVLASKNQKLLLCVPKCMNTTLHCNVRAMKYWIRWELKKQERIVPILREYRGSGYLFGDAQITRPYIDWKSSFRAKILFPMLKELWDDRDILIVEGEKSRLGIGNDLFSNAKSIKRILCPQTNAFEYREEIIKTVFENYSGELILMALGPTATVLAMDFAEAGMQALDIGHIDIEYEWFIAGATEKIPITNKYTDEGKGNRERIIPDCVDPDYQQQIIAKVCSGDKHLNL